MRKETTVTVVTAVMIVVVFVACETFRLSGTLSGEFGQADSEAVEQVHTGSE